MAITPTTHPGVDSHVHMIDRVTFALGSPSADAVRVHSPASGVADMGRRTTTAWPRHVSLLSACVSG